MRPMNSAGHSPTKPRESLGKDQSPSSLKAPSRPRLSQLLGGISRSGNMGKPARVRLGSEEEILKKNRRNVDNYLRRIGALMGKEVSLNEDGMCYLSYKCFVIVVEVPKDNKNNFYMYTMVCRVGAADNMNAVLHKAMELNYMERLTRGATLGLEGEEVNLCCSKPISGLPFADFKSAIEDFLETAAEVNEHLTTAKKAASGRDVVR